MERIKEKPTSVLVPIIDVIEAKNFYYSTNGYDTFQVSLEISKKASTAHVRMMMNELKKVRRLFFPQAKVKFLHQKTRAGSASKT